MARRLNAILAADIVGYSQLMGADEAGTLSALHHFRDDILGPAVATRRGEVVKSMGDGWLITFDSVADAASCAIHLQDKLARMPDLTLRIGIHIGDVTRENEDIFGASVNLAARLQEYAEPGAVALSEAAYFSLDGALAPSFDDAGGQDFKNIARTVQVWTRAPQEAPAPDAVDGRPQLIVRCDGVEGGETGQMAQSMAGDLGFHLGAINWLNTDVSEADEAFRLNLTLREKGPRLRAEARLTAPDGAMIWSDKLDGDVASAFDWEDEVVTSVASRAPTAILEGEKRRLRALSIDDLSAEECVIASMFEFAIVDQEGMIHNLRYLAAAIEKKPDLAEAYGHAICNYSASATMQLDEALKSQAHNWPRWLEAARKLPDPTPMLRIGLGIVAFRENGDAPALRGAIREALRRAPLTVEVLGYALFSHVWLGEAHQALELFRQAEKNLQLNHMAIPTLGGAAIASIQIGDDENAIAYAQRGLETTRGYSTLHFAMASALANQGRIEEARTRLADATALRPDARTSNMRASSKYADCPEVDRYFEGLRLAGLPV